MKRNADDVQVLSVTQNLTETASAEFNPLFWIHHW